MSKKHFPVRIPRYAKGIRAQTLRTEGSWWGKRWLAALSSKDIGGRLGRGKNYALSGQVTELEIDGPHVGAKVLGTRTEAYRVTIDFRTPVGAARKRILTALRSEPMLVARLLAGDLPTEVEAIFKLQGYDLFPGGKLSDDVRQTRIGKIGTSHQTLPYDMTTKCTCPDYANPCKHSDAVLLILGEEIARRPMALIELRGIQMEELYED